MRLNSLRLPNDTDKAAGASGADPIQDKVTRSPSSDGSCARFVCGRSARRRPSPIRPTVMIPQGGRGGNHECGDHSRCRFRSRFKLRWQGNFGQGNWIPVFIPLPHIPLPVPVPGPGDLRNAIAGRAHRSPTAPPTGGSSNWLFFSEVVMAWPPADGGRGVRAWRWEMRERTDRVEASDVGNRTGRPTELSAAPGSADERHASRGRRM